MKKLAFLLNVSTILLGAQATAASTSENRLLADFKQPPSAAKVRVWWHWMNGNVDIDGAKLDLAWMNKVGVGGVHVFSGGGYVPPVIENPKPFMTDGWRSVFKEATQIANANGMEVTIAGSPGWSQTGGPWVQAKDAMKKYVWTKIQAEGGKPFNKFLSKPATTTGPFAGVAKKSMANLPPEAVTGNYHDSHVIAFETPAADLRTAPVAYSIATGPLSLALIDSGDLSKSVAVPIADGTQSAFLQATFAQAVTVSALSLGVDARTSFDIQVREGTGFRTILHVDADPAEYPSPQQTYSFAPTTGSVFRVVFSVAPPRLTLSGMPMKLARPLVAQKAFTVTRFAFETGARVNRFEAKAGFESTIDFAANPTPPAPVDAVIPISGVLDLTSKLQADGHLDWTPPAGNWTILRFGYTLTGQTNGPAEGVATGLEVDKLDPTAVRAYMEHYLSLYADASGGKLGRGSVQNLLTDSWEAGVQNWTPTMLQQFKARRGYDATPYLPVLAGFVVGDAIASDKFIWDFRQTLKQMLADNHYAVIASVLHKHGMNYYAEAQGDTPRAIGDGMTMKSRADIPTGEFWYRPFATGPGQPSLKVDLKEAASVAHIYGKPLVAAESLTVAAGLDPWGFSPAMLKPVADEIFAHGINRILMHDSHHQPFVDKKPGLMMFFFGQFFNRNDTWANEAGAWLSYLSRTSHMLQQGRYVADIAYFYGEEMNLTELFEKNFNTDVPNGYHYDYINPEGLLTLLSVKDGRLVTPSGMSYRVLYLPANVTRMTLPALQKIRDLVLAGAIVVGPKPVGGLGIASSDQDIRTLADQLWGPQTGAATGHAFGKGRVYTGALSSVLQAEKIAPDALVGNVDAAQSIMTLHRQMHTADIYFVSNQSAQPQSLDMRFRVKGRLPTVWHAETGKTEPVSYRQTEYGTFIPLHLHPHEAVFVVFDGKTKRQSWNAPVTVSTILATLNGPWKVSFEPGRGAPANAEFEQLISWPTSPDPGIKYFSGAATYHQKLDVPKSWLSPGQRIVLDLGQVKDIAVVSVNGKAVATSWHAPYSVDLTRFVHPGVNALEIKVVNLWPNRLIGDQQPGATKYTYAPESSYTASSPLLPSGLLGPVQIISKKSK